MQKEIIFFLSVFTVINLHCSGQSDCSIYNQIINDIQSQLTKSKIVTSTPPEGHDPENPVFIYDTIENKQLLNFYIVKKKQDFNPATVKYWFSSFLNDTSLNFKGYQVNSNDSIINCNFTVNYKLIDFNDKINFEIDDYKSEIFKSEIIDFTPAKITFSNILHTENIAIVFAGVKIGTDSGNIIFGYILKKENCNWNIKKRNIETI